MSPRRGIASLGVVTSLAAAALALGAAALLPAGAAPGTACGLPVFRHEVRDSATIARLESAWNDAYVRGDTALERCLLTPDFTEIMRDGTVKGLADELGFAAANVGAHRTIPAAAPPRVLRHGDVAVAYGVGAGVHRTRYADYYVWEGGRWRSFFAQATPLVEPGPGASPPGS